MKLCLCVTISPATSFAFTHPGPALCLGRDPACDLPFDGEVSRPVSWHHARLQLTPAGAYLRDLASVNGTFVNDRRVAGQVVVRSGDLIQLGHTGPVLQVTELDLSQPPPQRPPRRKQRPQSESAPLPCPGPTSAFAHQNGFPAAGGLILDGDYAHFPSGVPDTPAAAHPWRPPRTALVAFLLAVSLMVLVGLVSWMLHGSTSVAASSPSPSIKAPQSPPPESPPAPAPEPPPAPPVTVKPLGEFHGSGEKAPAPVVLLRWAPNAQQWVCSRPGEQLFDEDVLMIPTVCPAQLDMKCGVYLIPWPNLPPNSLIQGSMVRLHKPDPGVDLDFTLDRGRVLLRLAKGRKAAHVRVRFQGQIWDLTLPDSHSEVALELCGLLQGPGVSSPLVFLNLTVKGGACLRIGNRECDLPDCGQLTWRNREPALAEPRVLPQLPAWWSGEVSVPAEIADALATLAAELNKGAPVGATVARVLQTAASAETQAMAVLFLGALDELAPVVAALNNDRHQEVRQAAALALAHQLGRSADAVQAVRRALRDRYAADTVDVIIRLLHTLTVEDPTQPATQGKLLNLLDHHELAVRQLAFDYLADLDPAGAPQVHYRPTASGVERRRAIASWRQRIEAAPGN